jgi:TolA-binding protein
VGTLDDATSLLQLGIAKERKGDLRGAATAFESLLSKYPESPLAHDARAALSRVRGTLGSQR